MLKGNQAYFCLQSGYFDNICQIFSNLLNSKKDDFHFPKYNILSVSGGGKIGIHYKTQNFEFWFKILKA